MIRGEGGGVKSWKRQALFQGRHYFCPTPTPGGGGGQSRRQAPLTALSTIPTQYQTTGNASIVKGSPLLPPKISTWRSLLHQPHYLFWHPGFEPSTLGLLVYHCTYQLCQTIAQGKTNILVTNVFPKQSQPSLGLPQPGGGGVIPWRPPRNSKKAGNPPPAPPPPGGGYPSHSKKA